MNRERFSRPDRQKRRYFCHLEFIPSSLSLSLSAWGHPLLFVDHTGNSVRYDSSIHFGSRQSERDKGPSRPKKIVTTRNLKNGLASRTILISTDPSSRQ